MWQKIVAIFFVLANLTQVECIDDCTPISNCKQCIQSPSCGWYHQYHSTNASGCFKNEYLDLEKTDTTKGHPHPPKPTIYVIRNASNQEITPQEVSLNLRLGEPLTFSFTFTPLHPSWTKKPIELKHDHHKPRIKVTFFTNCGNRHPFVETNKCDDVEVGDTVEFVVAVKQVSCAKRQPEKIQTVEVMVVPSVAIFRLNVYAYCYCPCEMEGGRGDAEIAIRCHGRGRVVCGVCYCREGYAGGACEINTANVMT